MHLCAVLSGAALVFCRTHALSASYPLRTKLAVSIGDFTDIPTETDS
jgi:hypothetical protein